MPCKDATHTAACSAWPVREYSWGKVPVLATATSDVLKLRDLVLVHGLDGLKRKTEASYHTYRCALPLGSMMLQLPACCSIEFLGLKVCGRQDTVSPLPVSVSWRQRIVKCYCPIA